MKEILTGKWVLKVNPEKEYHLFFSSVHKIWQLLYVSNNYVVLMVTFYQHY